MRKQTENQTYQTEKLTFAAYLIASNKADLIGTQSSGTAKNVIFVLSATPTENDTMQFFNGTGTVSALRYSEALNTLKSAAYEAKRRRENA